MNKNKNFRPLNLVRVSCALLACMVNIIVQFTLAQSSYVCFFAPCGYIQLWYHILHFLNFESGPKLTGSFLNTQYYRVIKCRIITHILIKYGILHMPYQCTCKATLYVYYTCFTEVCLAVFAVLIGRFPSISVQQWRYGYMCITLLVKYLWFYLCLLNIFKYMINY